MDTKNNNFVAAVIQMAFSIDMGENLKNAINWIEKAARQGAEVICLPELFRSQYFCQTEIIDNFNLAETIPGESTNEISKLAAKLNVAVVVPVFEASVTNDIVLHGLNKQLLINLNDEKIQMNKFPGLKVGDIAAANNNAGNWE